MSDDATDDKTNGPWRRQHRVIKNIAVVQCEGFRCLAYRDADIWRDFQTGKELPEVKTVVSTFSI